MNNKRRVALGKACTYLDAALSIVNNIKEQEQDSYDNMPEQFQEGDRGEKMENVISLLEDSISDIEQAYTEITEAKL